MLALMRCHLAYARTRGFDRAPDCLLYLRGVEINTASDGRGIEVTSREHAVALQIVRRSIAVSLMRARPAFKRHASERSRRSCRLESAPRE
jgi:hypothetical protein